MAEQYWRAYANDPRLAAMQAAVAAAAAPQSVPAKRPRSDFGDMAGGAPQYSAGGGPQFSAGGAPQYSAGGAAQYPAGGAAQYSAGNAAQYSAGGAPQYSDYPSRDDERGAGRLVVRDGNSLGASYDQYLRNGQMSSYGGPDTGRQPAGGLPSRPPVDDPRIMGMGGGDSRSSGYGGGRQDMSLPPDASNTLFVEGLPSDCTRREVSHIFRPFVGFREVRLVTKESRHPGGDPLVLCFVDFSSPNQAAVALDALQGYKFDEHDRESASLRLQFARFPGPRSGGGGPRGRR